MYSFPNSTRSHVSGKTPQQIGEDPQLRPFAENLIPLTLSGRNLTRRSKHKTVGEGTFGRVNLETLDEGKGQVATKYFLRNEDLEQNLSEIVTLKYLKGYPNVAQYVGVSSVNSQGVQQPFPALIMAKAQSSLVGSRVNRSWPTLFQTIVDILRGYHVLHSLGIAHRDTKPDNILRTAYGETWITDFGKSRYVADHIPILDAYTGTRWYCSPEILLKSLLKEKEDILAAHGIPEFSYSWFAQDCWGLGTSILELITDIPIFAHDGRRDILHKIFSIMGTPTPRDGELHRLCLLYQRMYGELRAVRKPLDNIFSVFLASNMHVDPSESGLDALATMIEGLLTYDPAKRFTPAQALECLGQLPAPIPRPLCVATYTLPSPPKRIDHLLSIIYGLASIRDESGFTISRRSKYIVIDRACVYLFSFLQNYPDFAESKNMTAIVITALILSSCLFNIYGDGFLLNFGKSFGIPEKMVVHYLQMFFQLDMPFYGVTFLDRMLSTFKPLSLLQQKQCGLLNLLCFQQMMYFNYADRIDELIDACVQTVNNPQSTLRTDLVDRDYDYSNLFVAKASVIEKIGSDLDRAMGGRNENVVRALRRAEFLQLKPDEQRQFINRHTRSRKSRRKVSS